MRMKSATELCWPCRLEIRHLFLTFGGARNRNSLAVGGAKAGDVNMDLDRLQEESHRRAAALVAAAPGIPVGSGLHLLLTHCSHKRRGEIEEEESSSSSFCL